MDPVERPSCGHLLRHVFFTKDNFAEKFATELKTRIAREVADNPLLKTLEGSRHDKDNDERVRRKEKKARKVRLWLINVLLELEIMQLYVLDYDYLFRFLNLSPFMQTVLSYLSLTYLLLTWILNSSPPSSLPSSTFLKYLIDDFIICLSTCVLI